MLEVINKKSGFLYKKQKIKAPTNEDILPQYKVTNEIKWKQVASIKQFPASLQGDVSVNFLFSPNFTYYFDVNIIQGNFVIKKTQDEQIHCLIPKQLLSLKKDGAGKEIDFVA